MCGADVLSILYCKIRFIVLLSAQKRDINHVGQKNPFLGNRISCHYGEDSCNGQRKREQDGKKSVQSWHRTAYGQRKVSEDGEKSVQSWHRTAYGQRKRERGWRKVSPKQA